VSHVLSPFSADERDLVNEVIDRAAEAVICVIGSGVETAMNRFNG
jgi:PTH1 family peptidyl-tRNA hydrolase